MINTKIQVIEKSELHFSIINIIKEIALFELNNDHNIDNILQLQSKLDHQFSDSQQLNDKKYTLFLYYPLIAFHQNHTTIEKAINIQNSAINIIKDCEKSISGFLLKQLFLKNPVLHQMIMEPLELEFVDDEGLDDMPAHIKSMITNTEISIPIKSTKLDLGTWQGIFLIEHRKAQGGAGFRRLITLSLIA